MAEAQQPVSPQEQPPLCPWCDSGTCVLSRMHDEGTEFRCLICGKRHTRHDGSDDAFVFFPGDLHRAFTTSDAEPFDLEGLLNGPVDEPLESVFEVPARNRERALEITLFTLLEIYGALHEASVKGQEFGVHLQAVPQMSPRWFLEGDYEITIAVKPAPPEPAGRWQPSLPQGSLVVPAGDREKALQTAYRIVTETHRILNGVIGAGQEFRVVMRNGIQPPEGHGGCEFKISVKDPT